MVTKKPIPLCFFFLISFGVFGQSKIEGDLLTLSELTLTKSPLIQRNALEIDLAKANFRVQRSIFDYQLSSGVNLSKYRLSLFDADPRNQVLSEDLKTKNTDLFISLQKKFRTGLLARISSSYSSVSDNLPLNRFDEKVAANISDQATSATLSLTQPLLRGNGLKVNTAFEKSAILDVESANQNFEFNTEFEVLQLGNAYWQYVSAYKVLEVYQENEDRVRHVLDITKDLVNADKKSESDLVQINADLAQQERQTIVAKQNFYDARINLGRVIGISERNSRNIGDPISEFPKIEESGFYQEVTIETITKLARIHRTDIKAFQNNQETLELQLGCCKKWYLTTIGS